MEMLSRHTLSRFTISRAFDASVVATARSAGSSEATLATTDDIPPCMCDKTNKMEREDCKLCDVSARNNSTVGDRAKKAKDAVKTRVIAQRAH